MSFNTSPGRAEYTAGAGQTAFPFSFKIYANTDIKVYQTLAGQVPDDTLDILMLTTHYTVTINGDLGGEVTLVSGAAINDSLTIVRDLPIERPIEYQNNGDLLAATLNQDQDYQTYLIADKDSANLRFISIPESAQGVSTTLPNPAPLNFVQWNPTGTGFQNVSSLQADGFIWTAADVYTKTETYSKIEANAAFAEDSQIADGKKLWDSQTTTHDFTSDADYTLTVAQNLYGRIILTDTTPFLTVARNVITDNIEKSFIVQNDTLQIITVKTLAGTGMPILPSEFAILHNDGTNIISIENKSNLLAEFEVTGAAVTSIDFSGLDINAHESYRVELDLINATASLAAIYCYVNGDTTPTNYYSQELFASAASIGGSRTNSAILSSIYPSFPSLSRANISLNAGYVQAECMTNRATPTAMEISQRALTKVATVTNITQLTFVSSVALSIGIGSKIRIYRGDR